MGDGVLFHVARAKCPSGGYSIQLSLASRGVSTARKGLWLRWNSSSWGVHKPYTSLNAKGVTRWVRGGTSAGHCARR